MEEVKYKLDNEYVPTLNNYQMWNGELVVTPIKRIPVDDDFGWTELREKTRNTVHDAMIPAAGFYFLHADTMPDLQIKIINLFIFFTTSHIVAEFHWYVKDLRLIILFLAIWHFIYCVYV